MLTQSVMSSYPAGVRSWLKRKGGLTPQLKYLNGRELSAMFLAAEANRARLIPRLKEPCRQVKVGVPLRECVRTLSLSYQSAATAMA